MKRYLSPWVSKPPISVDDPWVPMQHKHGTHIPTYEAVAPYLFDQISASRNPSALLRQRRDKEGNHNREQLKSHSET